MGWSGNTEAVMSSKNTKCQYLWVITLLSYQKANESISYLSPERELLLLSRQHSCGAVEDSVVNSAFH